MSKAFRSTFTVQTFVEKGNNLVPDSPQAATDEAHALRKVERMAVGKAGAVAVRQDGNIALGEFSEPVVLKVIGRVPLIFTELPF